MKDVAALGSRVAPRNDNRDHDEARWLISSLLKSGSYHCCRLNYFLLSEYPSDFFPMLNQAFHHSPDSGTVTIYKRFMGPEYYPV